MKEKEKKFHIERLRWKEEYGREKHREKIEEEMMQYEEMAAAKQR